MKNQRPTIFDLVKYTGISRGTISRAFNDQPGINPGTWEKILKAAKEIGYIPHSGARLMKSGSIRRWGLLLPHLQNPYYSEIVEALNRQAPGFDFVHYDFFDSFSQLLIQLRALGHERIGYVGQQFPFCRETSRFRAYQNFYKSCKKPLDEDLIVFGPDGAEGGINAWKVGSHTGKFPTAVVCCDDIIACGLVQAARHSGKRAPQDFSVAGVDDIAEAARLGLTTIHTDRNETAHVIFELLRLRRENFSRPAEVREISSELILRDSIGKRGGGV